MPMKRNKTQSNRHAAKGKTIKASTPAQSRKPKTSNQLAPRSPSQLTRKTAGEGGKPVTRTMNVMEIIALHPVTADIMATYGLHCFQCSFNTIDTLEAGARSHGLENDDIENMVNDLNDALKDAPPRPAILTVTAPAALAILDIAKTEGKDGQGLTVIAEEGGGFCMEFAVRAPAGAKTFTNAEVPAVRIFASMTTLARIGGSTIDFRDERFKLDLPEAKHTCGCAGGVCSCKRSTSQLY